MRSHQEPLFQHGTRGPRKFYQLRIATDLPMATGPPTIFVSFGFVASAPVTPPQPAPPRFHGCPVRREKMGHGSGSTLSQLTVEQWATVPWVCFCPLQPVFWTPRFSFPYNHFFKHESTFKRPQIERKFKHKNARKETHTRKKLPIDPK